MRITSLFSSSSSSFLFFFLRLGFLHSMPASPAPCCNKCLSLRGSGFFFDRICGLSVIVYVQKGGEFET